MNERIKELAELSGIHPCNFEPDADIKVPLEMFAELIVRECANICMEMSANGALAKDCAYWIKNDFGVEE